ncbi:UNVERIFIED_CONTAM: hypothetical protein Sangu_1918000 [Sesamum angustifolium]|uniref:Uncharacterized protein n=1 Tax=Sesamum angustifolium TaxID=2727405 RepID=A0AAW2LW00_9LAMI
MNMSTSECSSGCESGWTMYLDQHSNSTDPYSRGYVQNYEEKGVYVNYEDEEDEDLSMVSDASSGPPHFHEYENCGVDTQYYGYSPPGSEDKKKTKQKSKRKETRTMKQQNLCLDDTASSPVYHFSQASSRKGQEHRVLLLLSEIVIEFCVGCWISGQCTSFW